MTADTIAAIATASGAGGVGIIRLSGPSAIAIASAILGGKWLDDRRVVVGYAHDIAGNRLDEVVAFSFVAPRSFTGEDTAEIQGHGGAVNLGMLLRAAVDRGARIAEPGEFTRRAFENGKLDLTRAEGLLAVIDAGSERAWRIAQAQLGGALGAAVNALRERAIVVLADLEGRIDFPDEDLATTGGGWLRDELLAVSSESRRLADSFQLGRALRHGIEVALVGPVNVGKSSLLNALLGQERAIVADQPGTTRDVVEARTMWNGIAVTLIDTAGERSDTTADAIEQRGIELGRARAEQADVVVIVNDGVSPWDDGARFGRRALVVRSKADLALAPQHTALPTSAVTSAGLVELRREILARAGVADSEGSEGVIVTSERQRSLLATAADQSAAAVHGLDAHTPLEMLALDVRQATRALSDVIGQEVGEDMLDALFKRFCIGK